LQRALTALFKKGLLTLAQAAEEAGMTVAEFESKMIAIAASN
jgi:predicted HTH domain antitoxin